MGTSKTRHHDDPAGPTPPSPTHDDTPPGPPPAFVAASFCLTVLEPGGPKEYDQNADQVELGPPTWFAVTLTAPIDARYLFLVHKDTSEQIVLLLHLDRGDPKVGDGTGLRLPPAGAFLRAIVDGTLHVLGADRIVTRAEIVAAIGGHQPPPTQAKPPYT